MRNALHLGLICALLLWPAERARAIPLAQRAALEHHAARNGEPETEHALRGTSAAGRAGDPATESGTGQRDTEQRLTITVNGRQLTGPFSLPEQRGGRLFLPALSIARALGDSISADAAGRTVTARRQNGASADFNAALGHVRENGAVILVVARTEEIAFPPNLEQLLLPAEILAALLDVAVYADDAAGVVRIGRGTPAAIAGAAPPSAAGRSWGEIYQADYDLSLGLSNGAFARGLTLRSGGRIADGRFDFFANSAHEPGDGALPRLRSAAFVFARPNGQRFVAGDFVPHSDLLFLTPFLRGGLAQFLAGGARITAFAGRAASVPPPETLPLATQQTMPAATPENAALFPVAGASLSNRIRRNTNVYGAAIAFDAAEGDARANPFSFSAGALGFHGPHRRGQMATGSARYSSRRAQLQADVAAGRFAGLTGAGARIDGFGLAADLAGSFQASDQLTLQGRFAYIAPNFLSPQDGALTPLRLAAAGVTWRPTQWLTAAVSASDSLRLDSSRQRTRFINATVNTAPRSFLPAVFFSHTQSGGAQGGAYTLAHFTRDFSRFHLFATASRIKTNGQASVNAQLGTQWRFSETQSLRLSQSFGSGGALGGSADWLAPSFLHRRLSLGAGAGYQRSRSAGLSFSERLFATVRLPGEQTVQFTYTQSAAGPQMLVSVRGILRRPRRSENITRAPLAEINSYGSFSGRVYQDVNLNGRFDAEVDQPVARALVRVNGSRYVTTDEQGRYRMEDVRVGENSAALDLLTVRADLTLLDDAQQTISILAHRETTTDFRLVRTGRLTGMVWLDANDNGRYDAGETPLADVRIVVGNGRDTLTNADGVFVVADLPPGAHIVLVDESTLPERTRAAAGSLSIRIAPAGETGDVNFAVTPLPPETLRFN